MHLKFPAAVPEIPVRDLKAALDYYEKTLGFDVDWGRGEGNIAGISKGDCRIFLTDEFFWGHYHNTPPVMVWLNLGSIEEVRELHKDWTDSNAKIISAPEAKPWKLYEFTVADIDGNMFRVFYDFSGDEREINF